MIDENMLSRLVNELEKNQLKLANIEDKLVNFEQRLVEIDQKLVNTNYRTEKIEDHLANKMIQSMGKKPEVRWWVALEDEIARKFKSINLLNLCGIFFIFYSVVLFFRYFGKTFPNRVFLFFISILILLPSFLVVITTCKSAFNILKRNFYLVKIKILKNYIYLFIQFLITIFMIDITLFAINESIFKVLVFFYHNSTIAKIHILFRKYLIDFKPLFKDIIVYIIYIVSPIYSIIFSQILTAVNKATLQNFVYKWKNYKPTLLLLVIINYLISVGAIIHVCAQDQTFRTSKDSQSMIKFYDNLSSNFIWYFVLVYVLSFIEFIIANYKIDKELLIEWEEKNRQLQQFTTDLDSH